MLYWGLRDACASLRISEVLTAPGEA